MSRFLGAILTCSLLALVTVGCNSGPPVGLVTGKVTMDGEPLDNAQVSFVPQGSGVTATAITDANGNYELHRLDGPGAVVGTYKVVVTTVKQVENVETVDSEVATDSEAYEAQAMGLNMNAYAQAEESEPIPARYNKDSELVQEVQEGTNVVNLELTSK